MRSAWPTRPVGQSSLGHAQGGLAAGEAQCTRRQAQSRAVRVVHRRGAVRASSCNLPSYLPRRAGTTNGRLSNSSKPIITPQTILPQCNGILLVCGFGRFALRRCQRTCEAPLLLSCRAAWLRSKLAHRRVSVQWLGALLPIAHVLAVARDHRRGLMPLVAMTFQSTLGCGGRSASLSHGGLAARAWP